MSQGTGFWPFALNQRNLVCSDFGSLMASVSTETERPLKDGKSQHLVNAS